MSNKKQEISNNNDTANLGISVVSNRSYNELENLAEDLECVNMWLDDLGVPTHDESKKNEYSVIGRIQQLLKMNGC